MKIAVWCIAAMLITNLVSAGTYGVKTSSVIALPKLEVLGYNQNAWLAIGFEKPGTLSKPPEYKIYRYESHFSSGKISELFPSFGEKTVYLQSSIINNKIAMFYARCGKRADMEIMLDKRDSRRQLPEIYCQYYDVATLKAIGEPSKIFDETDDFFSPCDIVVAHSPDGGKTAILFKPYYKHQRFKVQIYDNNSGEVFSKTFECKKLKTYLKFEQIAVNNKGKLLIEAKQRNDVITLYSTSGSQTSTFYFFAIDQNTGNEPEPTEMVSGEGNYFSNPLLCTLTNDETVVAYDSYKNADDKAAKSTVVIKYDAGLNKTGTTELQPDGKFITQAETYHKFKRGQEFSHLRLQQVLPLSGGNFLLISEYSDTVSSGESPILEHNYILTYRVTGSLQVTGQHFIPKKQIGSRVTEAFSVIGFARGDSAFCFYNGDWETDDENNMNFMCTQLAPGTEPVTKKILNTSGDFFTSMQQKHTSANQILFCEEKRVDYEDVSKEVKLLEITLH